MNNKSAEWQREYYLTHDKYRMQGQGTACYKVVKGLTRILQLPTIAKLTTDNESVIKKLVLDDDVTKKAGIIPFILSDRTWRDEKHLSLRAFTESQKLRAYERQGHKCPLCVANGINTEYAFEDMEGDHIIPWSKGGHTTDNNLQMLCKKCNAAKSDR